jgi:uncharacterized membrane protein
MSPPGKRRGLSLLEQNDRQVKQNRLSEEFGWSSSKTSRVVNQLDEDGAVKKLRLGRENLVRLAERDDDF